MKSGRRKAEEKHIVEEKDFKFFPFFCSFFFFLDNNNLIKIQKNMKILHCKLHKKKHTTMHSIAYYWLDEILLNEKPPWNTNIWRNTKMTEKKKSLK